MADSKDKEPEVVFIGDSLVQLMHQCEVRPVPVPLPHPGLCPHRHTWIRESEVPKIASGSIPHPKSWCKVQHCTDEELCDLSLSDGGFFARLSEVRLYCLLKRVHSPNGYSQRMVIHKALVFLQNESQLE